MEVSVFLLMTDTATATHYHTAVRIPMFCPCPLDPSMEIGNFFIAYLYSSESKYSGCSRDKIQ